MIFANSWMVLTPTSLCRNDAMAMAGADYLGKTCHEVVNREDYGTATCALTKAYAQAKTSRETLVVANLQYSGIIFSAVFGMLYFGDVIPMLGWLGMLLIAGSGITATLLRARNAPDAPSEDR